MTIDTLVIGDSGWLVRAELNYTLYHKLAVGTKTEASGEPQTFNIARKLVDQLPVGVILGVPEVLLSGSTVTFRTQAGAWHCPVQATRDLAPPVVPEGTWSPGAVLQEIWRPLLAALGTDISRARMCALELVEDEYGNGHAAATDGYRLAYWHGELATGVPGTSLWPTNAVRWLERRRAWEWLVDGKKIWARGPGWLLNATSDDGGFPDYRSFVTISLSEHASCQVNTKDLSASMKLCATGGKPRRVRLDWENGVLNLSGSASNDGTSAFTSLKTQTVGSASVLMDPDVLRPLLVGFQAKAKSVTLHSQGSVKPLYITAGNHIALQMPCSEEKKPTR